MPISRLGVCSWSLRPETPEDLLSCLLDTGLQAVQLALTPVVSDRDVWGRTIDILQARDIRLLSGMIAPVGEDYSTIDRIKETGGVRPAAHWPANEAMARAACVIAAQSGMGLVTLHAGFLPHDPDDPERAAMVKRLQLLADIGNAQGVRIGLETGQEAADTLLAVLSEIDRPNLGVNFDPANMVLYGTGDPIEAFEQLAAHTVQVHIKDALPPEEEGRWGTEVPLGKGVVDWDRFMAIADGIERDIDAVIEREAGEDRAGDIRIAVDAIGAHLS
jgi:sugar phosphate isomerase/epimerase